MLTVRYFSLFPDAVRRHRPPAVRCMLTVRYVSLFSDAIC